ncbi:hypothetical protein [Streptomyces boluensis]|uniref:Uncharacterized protein n=1 Tax=Streptomyces boluensis TaxID=1775135 RepID=A0A964V1J2_9ACTN|nr:hypothetical protein [Streptomyces boluensis]NBE56882.1 hypothetical protein [Streptomyces boluensis]
MNLWLPSTHEKTELLEVVRLDPGGDALRWEGLVGETVAIWDGGEVQRGLELVLGLKAGDLYRCFTPGWGIRAHDRVGVLFEVAFCFRCHGARVWAPEAAVPREHRLQGFDADGAEAVELLRLFRLSSG